CIREASRRTLQHVAFAWNARVSPRRAPHHLTLTLVAHGGHLTQMRASRKRESLDEQTMERALERFRGVVHKRSLRMTPVREAILRAALTYDGHFDVQELTQVLRDHGVREAAMATVYRAMPLLVEAGLVQPTLLSSGD